MKLYISDYHIGHPNVLKFDSRPFSSLDEMHETIIRRWNSAVAPNDEVYILGDFAWNNEKGAEVLRQLKGKKYLILGNHDRLNAELRSHFVWIKDMETVKDGSNHVVLCHYPLAHWRNADYGYIHLYGHIHEGRDAEPYEQYTEKMKKRGLPYESYNVGCMISYMAYTPRTLEEIMRGAAELDYQKHSLLGWNPYRE